MTTDEALLTLQLDGMERLAEAHDVLAAEVRRCHARRCETCRHRYSQPDVPDFYCAKTTFRICRPENLSEAAWLLVATCNDLGGGCLAWEKRDD